MLDLTAPHTPDVQPSSSSHSQIDNRSGIKQPGRFAHQRCQLLPVQISKAAPLREDQHGIGLGHAERDRSPFHQATDKREISRFNLSCKQIWSKTQRALSNDRSSDPRTVKHLVFVIAIGDCIPINVMHVVRHSTTNGFISPTVMRRKYNAGSRCSCNRQA